MGKIWNQLRELRSHLAGHFMYDVLKWAVLLGASVMTAAIVRWIQGLRHAPQQDLLGYIIVAILVFIALTLCVFSIMLKKRFSEKDSTPTIAPLPEAPPEPEKEAEAAPLKPPPTVDLHGSIENIYFLGASAPYLVNYSVYVKLRITNHGPDEAVITKWYLYISIGETDKVQGNSVDLPANLAIKRPDTNYLLMPQNFRYESLQPDLTKVPLSEPYRKGIPKEGWVRFDPSDYGSAPPVNGAFFIYLEDSLGNVHWITRKPQSYKVDGELIQLPDSPTMSLSSGT